MQSNLLGLLIAAILVSPAPRAPAAAGEPAVASAAAAQESDIALRKYQLEKSRCRATAGTSEAACVRLARQQYRAQRADAETPPKAR